MKEVAPAIYAQPLYHIINRRNPGTGKTNRIIVADPEMRFVKGGSETNILNEINRSLRGVSLAFFSTDMIIFDAYDY